VIPTDAPEPHKRRVRYKGRNPRRFEDKYKELNPALHADTIAKVRASGKTPAGQHVPIMLGEIMAVLAPQPGERAVDCTLGYGGHATALLKAVQPGGSLLALDQDPIEIEKTGARMRSFGFQQDSLIVKRTNFAGLRHVLTALGWIDGADVILADLGVSSMQIDNPARGFTFKQEGPLDMRMNPHKGLSAGEMLRKLDGRKLADLLSENADEPRAAPLGEALAGRSFNTTSELARAVRQTLPDQWDEAQKQDTIRRVFQALRIAVNDEFGVLETWLRSLPQVLKPEGRVAVLTFHSGEDRRVKKAFQSGLHDGSYAAISEQVIRPTPEEVRGNPRASPAKLRWAVRR
jgi:16S rRNA (cytosine1402-N4)-methyltransferase